MEKMIRILSLNVGMNHSLAGLSSLVVVNNVDIVLLQEVTIPQDQFDSLVGSFGFKGEVNIDPDSPSKPGTAVAWRHCISIDHIFTTNLCRSQLLKIGSFVFINIYAPSGSEKRHDRSIFFAQDIFQVFHMFPVYNIYFLEISTVF